MSPLHRKHRQAVHNAGEFGRVAVMFGGKSSEREVSLDSGSAVLEALRSRGIDAHAWDPAGKTLQQFATAGFQRVWIALHGPGGEDGALQGALQWLEMPYTGSGVAASAIAMDKVRSKQLFAAAGLLTPDFSVVTSVREAQAAIENLAFPVFVKPTGQGSSVGMSKVEHSNDLEAAIKLAMNFGDSALVERAVAGTEMTVSILQGVALPSIRIETPHEFYDYQAKYESDTTTYTCPGTDDQALEARLQRTAVKAFDALGCSGWGRVDFMVGEDKEPQLIEINTVPGMTSHSLVPMAARESGIDFAELCWRVLETSVTSKQNIATVGVAANDA